MAIGDAILPEEAIIYIVANGTAPSSLASSDAVTAEVTNVSHSGGEEEVESRMVFGGGNIDLVKPRTQIEVSFDVILRYAASSTLQSRWDSFVWSSTLASNSDSPKKDIYVQFSDGTNYYTLNYQDAKAVTFDRDIAADDLVSGTINFKLSPTDPDGNANHKVTSAAATATTWS